MNVQDNEWKAIPKEKLFSFFTTLTDIFGNPQTPLTINLKQSLSLYLASSTPDQFAKQSLSKSIRQLSKIEYIPKTKGRLCGGLLNKGEQAYKCYQCMTEENSVLCQKCFQLDKHIGHDFERFSVYGGCCDCGDIQKWKEGGFCTEHSKDQEIQIILDESILHDFLYEHNYAFEVLLKLYNKFLSFQEMIMKQSWKFPYESAEKKAKEEVAICIVKIIDFYGGQFCNELIQFNKAGKFANAMTNHFFNQSITIPVFVNGQIKEVKNDVFSYLFSMLKLTVVPQKISELCITLFPMVNFRQRVTLKYIDCYNKDQYFPTSNYTHLSSQLLTSHMMITKLITQGRIHALSYYPVCNKEEEVQKLAEGFLRYYYDMKYLSKLYENASLSYFKLHAHEKKFVNLGEYRIILNGFPRAIDFYGLDQIFMEKMLFVIKVMQKDESQQLANIVSRQLYEFITTHNTEKHNRFRPQERFLTLIIFTKMRGNMDVLDDPSFMNHLFGCLGVGNFKAELDHLLKNYNSVIERAAQILENNTLVQGNYTFYSFYMKKSQKLFNADALLLKILYKMTLYYNTLQNDKISFDQMLLKHCHRPLLVLQQFQPSHTNQMIDQDQNFITKACKTTKTIKNYISFILQSLFSDLPQLSIMCALQPTQKELKQSKTLLKMPLQQLAHHYYQQLLQSQQTNKISIKSFKAACQIFFKEEQVFKEFVKMHKDPLDAMRLVKPQQSVARISELYFRSLSALPANKYMGLQAPPYYKWDRSIQVEGLVEMIEQTVKLVEEANKLMAQHQPSIANLGYLEVQPQDIFSNGLLQIAIQDGQQDVKQYILGDLPQLIVQLWKITLLTESSQAKNLLKELVKKDWIRKGLATLGPEQLNKIVSQACLDTSLADEKQRKEAQKKKLMEKKNLLKSKMNKNTEIILQNQPAGIFEESQNHHICSLCKDNDTVKQNLCLLGFVAFTPQDGYSASHKYQNQKIVPIFDSCGHSVHASCLTSILNKNFVNKVYSVCPLCKNPTNIQIPLKQEYNPWDREFLSQGLKKVYDTLEYPYRHEDLHQILRQSLAFEAVFKGYLLPELFEKNLTIYKILYKLYLLALKTENPDIKHIVKAENPLVKALKFVCFLLEHYDDAPDLKKYGYFGFSEHFGEKGLELLRKLKSQSIKDTISDDVPEIKQIKSYIYFPQLQRNLSSMNSKYRGKCEQCGLITNQQVVCMNCPNFVTCSSCERIKPGKHSNDFHYGVNVFLKTATGEVVYFMRNRFWKFPSLYEDYMGRAFSSASKQREQYELNTARLEDVKKDIYLCKVEQKVRYKENQTKQVHHQQIF